MTTTTSHEGKAGNELDEWPVLRASRFIPLLVCMFSLPLRRIAVCTVTASQQGVTTTVDGADRLEG